MSAPETFPEGHATTAVEQTSNTTAATDDTVGSHLASDQPNSTDQLPPTTATEASSTTASAPIALVEVKTEPNADNDKKRVRPPEDDDVIVTAVRTPQRKRKKTNDIEVKNEDGTVTVPIEAETQAWVQQFSGIDPRFATTGPRKRKQTVFYGRITYDDFDDDDENDLIPVRSVGRPRKSNSSSKSTASKSQNVGTQASSNTSSEKDKDNAAYVPEDQQSSEREPTHSSTDKAKKKKKKKKNDVYTPKERRPRAKLQEGYKGSELLKKIFTRKKDISTTPMNASPSGAKRVPSQAALLNPTVYIKADLLPPLWESIRNEWDHDHSDYAGVAIVVKNPFWLGNVWISASVSDLVALAFTHFECINLAMQMQVMKHSTHENNKIFFVHSSDFSQYYRSTECDSIIPQVLPHVRDMSAAAVFIPVELARNLMGLIVIFPRWRYIVALVPCEKGQTPEQQRQQLDELAEEEYRLRVQAHKEHLMQKRRGSSISSNSEEEEEDYSKQSTSSQPNSNTTDNSNAVYFKPDPLSQDANTAAEYGVAIKSEGDQAVYAQYNPTWYNAPEDGYGQNYFAMPEDFNARSTTAEFVTVKEEPMEQPPPVEPIVILDDDESATQHFVPIKPDPLGPEVVVKPDPMDVEPSSLPVKPDPLPATETESSVPPGEPANGSSTDIPANIETKPEPVYTLPPLRFEGPPPAFEDIPFNNDAVASDDEFVIPVALRRPRRNTRPPQHLTELQEEPQQKEQPKQPRKRGRPRKNQQQTQTEPTTQYVMEPTPYRSNAIDGNSQTSSVDSPPSPVPPAIEPTEPLPPPLEPIEPVPPALEPLEPVPPSLAGVDASTSNTNTNPITGEAGVQQVTQASVETAAKTELGSGDGSASTSELSAHVNQPQVVDVSPVIKKRGRPPKNKDQPPKSKDKEKSRRKRSDDEDDYVDEYVQPTVRRRSSSGHTTIQAPRPYQKLQCTMVELAARYASYCNELCGSTTTPDGVEQTSTWHCETVYLPVDLKSKHTVAKKSGLAALAWQNSLMSLVLDDQEYSTEHLGQVQKASINHNPTAYDGSGVWNEVILPKISRLKTANPHALKWANSLTSETFDDEACEKEWRERVLWCIDKYQCDPYVRATTMLESVRIFAAATWDYYQGLQARSKGVPKGPVIDIKEEFTYIYSSKTLAQASQRGREVYERIKETETTEQGRFACKLLHYVMGMIYVKQNFIWMDYRLLPIRPFSKTGFTITKTYYFYCAQYPQCFLLNYSFGHSTANMVNIHYYLERHEDEEVRAKWKEPVPILEDLEQMYATLYGK